MIETSPLLTSPVNGKTEVPVHVYLSWSPVQGAKSYSLQLSTTNDFSIIENQDSNLLDFIKDYNINLIQLIEYYLYL